MTFFALDEVRSGYQLNQYALLEPIGYGGQGTIWSAIDTTEQRVAALKLSPIGSEDESANYVELSHEADTVRKLSHPNILPIYEFAVGERARYLAMMYAPGGSLLDRLKRGPLDIHNSLFIAAQIAAALAFVHTQRVIHRDLKPSNILTNLRSHAYLSDFGLARTVSDETKQLHTGHGTRAYSPPEQILGKSVTHRSDIYSFGVLLYELFSGNLPWNGAKTLATSQMHENETLPFPVTAPPEFSGALLDALRRLTAPEPTQRPESVEEAFDEVCGGLVSGKFPKDVLDRIRARAVAPADQAMMETQNASDVLRETLAASRKTVLSLTQFSLVDRLRWHDGDTSLDLPPEQRDLMWEAALHHGRSMDHWWGEIEPPKARMEACERVIGHAGGEVLERVIAMMASETDQTLRQHPISHDGLRRLLEAGLASPDVTLQSRAIDLLQRIPDATARWQRVAFDEDLDRRLGETSLGDGFAARETARYIGQLHSLTALQVILDAWVVGKSHRALDALCEAAFSANGLPAVVPLDVRLRVAARLMWSQIAARPRQLARGLMLSILAGSAGLFLHYYLVLEAPRFLDAERLLVALERAVFSGPFLGIAIFVVRLLAKRLTIPSRAAGFIASLAAGTVGCSIAFFVIDYLFLKVMPDVPVVMAGSLAVSLGFALAERLRRPSWQVRMLVGSAGLWGGIFGAWVLYVLAGVGPLLYFSNLWGLDQVFASAGMVALVTSLITHLVDLT